MYFSYALLLPLFGCNPSPWKDVYEREIRWRDRAAKGNLVSLSESAPLRHAPRLIIHADRIEFDNRAWWLSLPDSFFLRDLKRASWSEETEEKKSVLFEKHVLSLEKGVLPASAVLNNEITDLATTLKTYKTTIENNAYRYEDQLVVKAFAEIMIPSEHPSGGESIKENPSEETKAHPPKTYTEEEIIQLGQNSFGFQNHINVFADKDVPMPTFIQALSTVKKNAFYSVTYAGIHDGTVAGIKTHPFDPNDPNPYINAWPVGGILCQLHLQPNRTALRCHRREREKYPPLALGSNGDEGNWKALLLRFRSLQDDCYQEAHMNPNYHEIERRSFNDPQTDHSVALQILPSPQMNFGDFMEIYQFGYLSYPQWKMQYFPAYGAPSEELDRFTIDLTDLTRVEKRAICNALFQTEFKDANFRTAFPEFEKWYKPFRPEPFELKDGSVFGAPFSENNLDAVLDRFHTEKISETP